MADGLLLINLGTPDDPSPGAVRRYLRQFLGDPRVLDMNAVGRALLLNLIILPTRPRKSAHAYQQIWDATRGSPLLYNSRDLQEAVAARLGPGWVVELGMRYGNPSIASALDRLIAAGVERIVALPLFPHTASSSSGSALEELYRLAAARLTVPRLLTVPAFHDDAGFLDAEVAVAAPVLAAHQPDHVLCSFHGLPERHMRAADPAGDRCLATTSCCDRLDAGNRDCYRAQCYATARALTTRLGLPAEQVSVAFQSRLGKIPWIRPYFDDALIELAGRGVKRVVVLCPAFVADCLETVEEIGMRAVATWKQLGGEELVLVPSLNASPDWVEAVAAMARRAAGTSDQRV
ncbi:MAG: ferrochelatase [Myxococcales bacterium]|nr:ferrochelatase [Myxococcales bacterium]